MKKFKHYLSLVKISHTIFAMPFALLAFVAAYKFNQQEFRGLLLIQIVLCMFTARNAAMSFNRWTDRHFDAANPRTKKREIPAGLLTTRNVLIFCISQCLVFMLCAAWINPLCFYLSPIALLIILGYSLAKRFTFLCHFILGLGLAIAPAGAYIAVTGKLDWLPICLSLMVLTWVGGFDILYALSDEEFDRSSNLHSIPAKVGRVNAMHISQLAHALSAGLCIYIGIVFPFNRIYYIGAAVFIAMLIRQHSLIKPHDISRMNEAFGISNGVASIIYGTLSILSIL